MDASVYEDPATEMNSVDGSPFNRLGLLKQKLLPNKYLHLLFFRRPSQFVRFHSVYGWALMQNNQNITRIDIDEGPGRAGTHGYEVRLMRRGQTFHKFFGDSSSGSKRKALAAARVYRDVLKATHQPYSRKEVAQLKSIRNTSGTVGIRLSEEVDRRGPNELVYLYWVAQWSPKSGVRKTRRFSVTKYGEEEAFRLAQKARRDGLKSMEETER